MSKPQITVYTKLKINTSDMLHDFIMIFNRTLNYNDYKASNGILNKDDYCQL